MSFFTKKIYCGFIQGHDYLEKSSLEIIESLVGKNDQAIVTSFENRFSEIIGDGDCISYASGRMGFYALLTHLSIGEGDEVILPGATCAVMANAVLRVGAKPVYTDIDPYTFGSSKQHIEKKITPLTRLIVAQHSFGIPCRIKGIVDIAKQNNIFLLEDCALSVDSSFQGVSVGNFGDAALFSTDHTKPVNTIIGGMIYTRDKALASDLLEARNSYQSLDEMKQKSIWQCLLDEKKYCRPDRYVRFENYSRLFRIFRRLKNEPGPFLVDDSGTNHHSSYPYPAKFPAFLAAVGLKELEIWEQRKQERKYLLSELLTLVRRKKVSRYISDVYSDVDFEITPLRFVWTEPEMLATRRQLSNVIHTSWTWFMEPVISTSSPLSNLGYEAGDCSVSESIGPRMVNIPCNIASEYFDDLMTELDNTLP